MHKAAGFRNSIRDSAYAFLQEQTVNDQKALAEILATLIQYKKAQKHPDGLQPVLVVGVM